MFLNVAIPAVKEREHPLGMERTTWLVLTSNLSPGL